MTETDWKVQNRKYLSHISHFTVQYFSFSISDFLAGYRVKMINSLHLTLLLITGKNGLNSKSPKKRSKFEFWVSWVFRTFWILEQFWLFCITVNLTLKRTYALLSKNHRKENHRKFSCFSKKKCISLQILTLEILQFFFRIWNNSGLTGFPSGRANLSVFISVLESLQKSQSLIDRSAHRQIVHGDLPQNTFVVDDKETAETVTVVFQVHSVVLWDLVGDIGQ